MAVNVMRQVPVLKNHEYKPSSMQVWCIGMILHIKLEKQLAEKDLKGEGVATNIEICKQYENNHGIIIVV